MDRPTIPIPSVLYISLSLVSVMACVCARHSPFWLLVQLGHSLLFLWMEGEMHACESEQGTGGGDTGDHRTIAHLHALASIPTLSDNKISIFRIFSVVGKRKMVS
jgi:hypothetical protein